MSKRGDIPGKRPDRLVRVRSVRLTADEDEKMVKSMGKNKLKTPAAEIRRGYLTSIGALQR